MKKTVIFLTIFAVALFIAGCTLTEEQVQAIATQAGQVAGTAVQVGAPAVGISPEATGGIAGAVATAVTAGVALLIRRFIRKPTPGA